MKMVKNALILLSISFSIGFSAGTIDKGPAYIKDKHYKVGKDNRGSAKEYDKDYDLRFWAIANFGKSFNIKKVSETISKQVKTEKKTHYANNWYWQTLKNDEYLMIGYANETTGEHTQALVKKVDNTLFYTCNSESWYKLKDGESSSCSARVGYDTVKFQFSNPVDGKNWSSSDVAYRFMVKDR